MAAAVQPNVSAARLRAMVVPREHGAWGILLIPLATGAAVGTRTLGGAALVVVFTIAALALFWLRTPAESLIGAGPLHAQSGTERREVFSAIGALGAVAAISLSVLFFAGARSGLLMIGGVAAVAFVLQAGLKKIGRRFYMAAQVIGSLGLTATAPAAYYVASGRLNATAFALWMANWMFAGNQIHFVQLRIHAARLTSVREKIHRGAMFLAGQAVLAAALWAGWRMGWLPGLVLIAFVPVLIRGLLWFASGRQTLAVRRLGWTELAHGAGFGALLIAAFLL